jgi:hypothetical protein
MDDEQSLRTICRVYTSPSLSQHALVAGQILSVVHPVGLSPSIDPATGGEGDPKTADWIRGIGFNSEHEGFPRCVNTLRSFPYLQAKLELTVCLVYISSLMAAAAPYVAPGRQRCLVRNVYMSSFAMTNIDDSSQLLPRP